jgi:iduronate 2-sulfatase
MDAQFGKVIGAVDLSNTVVVVWGDHGFHLGEHNLWGKTTNFELDTRSPLIVRTPWQKRRGTTSAGLVELLDIYPTLADVCGLPAATVEGRSFAKMLDDPQSPGKQEAWSQFPRGDLMGYSVRTSQYRYTSWRKGDSVSAEELYDSPEERINRAKDPKFARMLAEARGRRIP